jgi:hypothetical protein
MDSWVLQQLRVAVLSDLEEFIPKNYFETEEIQLHDSLKGKDLLSFEITWGILAAKLGTKLHSKPPKSFSARQVSACDILMNLGMLASSEASLNVTEQISSKALNNDVFDCNSGNVANQIKTEHIPIFHKNILGALEQYAYHLSFDEIKPYISLLPENKQKEIKDMAQEKSKVINNNINISGDNNGNVQVGEQNDMHQLKPNNKNNVLKWIAKHLVSLALTIIAGVIVYKITVG